MPESINIGGRTCRIFGSEAPACLLVQPSARHENATLEAEAAQIAALSPIPWPDGNISRDPEAGRHGQETPVILGGYSLGGLFSLWASTQTDTFKAIAAASPSVWIHGWPPYARKHVTLANQVYLSLGEQEEHVKNLAISLVGDNLRAYHDLLQKQLGPERSTLVWEEGNHFTDNEGRLARAFAWCMSTADFPVL